MKMGSLRGYQGYYAGFASRLLAMIIDTVILVLTYVGLAWFISVALRILPLGRIFGFSLSALLGQQESGQVLSTETVIAVFTLSTIVYYVFLWTMTGQTLGMILLGLRVVTIEGRRLTIWRAILRFIGYMIAALPFFLGFVWVLVDDRRQGWHDKIAGTYVAYVWAARPDERFLVHALENIEGERNDNNFN
jgi:uncharacterized RDD family membrane protein YckC